MEKILLGSDEFEGYSVDFPKSRLLVIVGRNGVLGCGYFQIETANRSGDALAVVTGVKSLDEMLTAEVRRVSAAAESLGVVPGMSGRDALMLMR